MFLRFIFFSFLFCSISAVQAQYYYKDILNTKEATSLLVSYKQNKVKTITVNMLELDGTPAKGFFCQKKIQKNYQKTELFTRTDGSVASLMTSIFDVKANLLSSTDSSAISVSHTIYKYMADGKLLSITSFIKSNDDDFVTEITEEHLYKYDAAGKIESMHRVKNHRDSSLILFAYDETGKLVLEKNSNTGTKFYYYYDAAGQLSDIVQNSEGMKRLYPDYVFTYNRQGLLIQMITTGDSGGDYQTWKYFYDNTLRTTEKMYGRDKKLVGTIEYVYKK